GLIQQVDLDARFDVHVGAEGGLQRLVIHFAIDHQLAVIHDALGEVAVEVLGDLLQIALRGGVGDQRVDDTGDQEEANQGEREVA
ncbi:MAG: hypothetical protein P8178_13680, partial [Candidatus Thiodiazotropha sp.]